MGQPAPAPFVNLPPVTADKSIEPSTFAVPSSVSGGFPDTIDYAGMALDPHLVFLLFLLGFCLLYVGLLVLDLVLERGSRDVTTDSEKNV
jgi:hypothetical protein